MAASDKLVDILRSNLEGVEKPASYEKLRQKLRDIQPPKGQTPRIKESPENVREIGPYDKDSLE